jgi:hypothetical protein
MIYMPSHRISATPLGRGPHFMGVELEVECVPTEKNTRPERGELADKVVNLFPDGFVVCKGDGSISYGFEIVTRPASLAYHRTAWAKFFKKHGRNIASYNHVNTGLHIHCSRAPLSDLTIGRMLVFLNRAPNRDFIVRLSQRNYFSYCEIKPEKKLTDLNNGARYELLNLLNRDTVEFRLFKGNCSQLAVFRALDFCDALIHFAGKHQSTQAWQSVPVFCAFVRRNKTRWPYLDKFLSRSWPDYRNKTLKTRTARKPKAKPTRKTEPKADKDATFMECLGLLELTPTN